MTLLLDNYDSFTYNLQDYFAQLKLPCTVFRNDEKTLEEIILLQPEAMILSPGPETPSKAGIMLKLIDHFHNKIPLLGICLGHQAIGEFFGAKLVKANKPQHGKTSMICHNGHRIFKNIPSPFEAMRYHSLLLTKIDESKFDIIAKTNEEEVMAIVHREFPLTGFQFHPESILTSNGLMLLKNWMNEFLVSNRLLSAAD